MFDLFRLMLVTGDNNGKLFTGFRIRVLFVQTGLKVMNCKSVTN